MEERAVYGSPPPQRATLSLTAAELEILHDALATIPGADVLKLKIEAALETFNLDIPDDDTGLQEYLKELKS